MQEDPAVLRLLQSHQGPQQEEYQVLYMYKGDTGGTVLQGQEEAMFAGISWDHMRLRRTLVSTEAERTRVAVKTQYLGPFGVNKTGLHRSVPEAKNIREWLKKGYQVCAMSKDNTGEAKFQGHGVARLSGTAWDHTRIQEPFISLQAMVDKTLHL